MNMLDSVVKLNGQVLFQIGKDEEWKKMTANDLMLPDLFEGIADLSQGDFNWIDTSILPPEFKTPKPSYEVLDPFLDVGSMTEWKDNGLGSLKSMAANTISNNKAYLDRPFDCREDESEDEDSEDIDEKYSNDNESEDEFIKKRAYIGNNVCKEDEDVGTEDSSDDEPVEKKANFGNNSHNEDEDADKEDSSDSEDEFELAKKRMFIGNGWYKNDSSDDNSFVGFEREAFENAFIENHSGNSVERATNDNDPGNFVESVRAATTNDSVEKETTENVSIEMKSSDSDTVEMKTSDNTDDESVEMMTIDNQSIERVQFENESFEMVTDASNESN